ncbi:DUF2567 domain-containing protein [Streptomyces crystallinus]|uniref:ABC transporter permease n=1 Tax=Streptomyces crystallinus TaxID=68191 RepID=A0ABP3S0E6_9ACTN
MTAPLTPPHQPPPDDDAWQDSAQPRSGPGAEGPYALASEEGTAMRTELREAVVAAFAVAVTGVLLGLLWVWLAPRVPLVSDDKAVFLKDTEGEEAIGADGTFILLALAFGVVCAAVVFLLRKRGGIPLVVGLAAGALLGSWLAVTLGEWLGPTDDVVAAARAAGKGVVFDAPLRLNAKGALLAWPLAAMGTHLALTALFAPRDPEVWPAAEL